MLQKIAIVGLGKAGRTIHVPALRKLPEVAIVGGYDIGSSRDNSVPHFDSLDHMLTTTKPDILIIATPPSSHVDIARRGLLAGCHVFCEKPLAETLTEADELATLAKSVNRQVIVNSEFPFMTIHLEAKRRMTQPGFGHLQFVIMNQTFVVTPQTEEGWRGADARRTLKEFGTHVIDLAKFFFNERPRTIRARMSRPGGDDGPDYLNILELGFSGDRFAYIVLDRLSRGPHRYLDIRLDGTEATIETSIGGRFQMTIGLQPRTRLPFADINVAMGGTAHIYHGATRQRIAAAPIDLFADATARLLECTIAALKAGVPPPYTLDDARHTLRLLLSCYESPTGDTIECDAW